MVHFDFTLSDKEAENLFDCISERIFKLQEEKFYDSMDKEQHAKRLDAAINYYKELKNKLHNTKV